MRPGHAAVIGGIVACPPAGAIVGYNRLGSFGDWHAPTRMVSDPGASPDFSGADGRLSLSRRQHRGDKTSRNLATSSIVATRPRRPRGARLRIGPAPSEEEV